MDVQTVLPGFLCNESNTLKPTNFPDNLQHYMPSFCKNPGHLPHWHQSDTMGAHAPDRSPFCRHKPYPRHSNGVICFPIQAVPPATERLQTNIFYHRNLNDNRISHSIRLLLATGLRGQELVALQAEHIEPDGSMVYVRQAVKMVKGTATIGNTKSIEGNRDVPVPEYARPSALFLREQAGEFVWDSKVAGKPINMRNFRLLFTQALKNIKGVSATLTPHCCRHTYVTNLQSLGVDAETIRSIVGHADIDMTAHYIHVQEETKQRAISQLDKVLSA